MTDGGMLVTGTFKGHARRLVRACMRGWTGYPPTLRRNPDLSQWTSCQELSLIGLTVVLWERLCAIEIYSAGSVEVVIEA